VKKFAEGTILVLAWVSIAGICLLGGLVTYWLLWPYPTIIIHNEPVPIVSMHNGTKRGDILRLHMVWTKYTPVGADVSRMLIHCSTKEIIVIYTGSSLVPAGEHDRDIVVPIPSWVPAGHYRLRTTYTYQVNPLRPISVSWESEPFEIVE